MVTLTLSLTVEQATSLHDLVVDADMNGGLVRFPTPLPAGLHDAVAEPILAALRDGADPGAMSPLEERLWTQAAAKIRDESDLTPTDAIADAIRVFEAWGE